MNKSAFTFVEIIVVIVIISLASVFGISAWQSYSQKAMFERVVYEVIENFQDARGYALKNAEIEGNIYETYEVDFDPAADTTTLTADGDPGPYLVNYVEYGVYADLQGVASTITYEAPYASCTIVPDPGGDLELTIVAEKGGFEEVILIYEHSCIAELVQD